MPLKRVGFWGFPLRCSARSLFGTNKILMARSLIKVKSSLMGRKPQRRKQNSNSLTLSQHIFLERIPNSLRRVLSYCHHNIDQFLGRRVFVLPALLVLLPALGINLSRLGQEVQLHHISAKCCALFRISQLRAWLGCSFYEVLSFPLS